MRIVLAHKAPNCRAMNPAERLAIIRSKVSKHPACFAPNPDGLFRAGHPDQPAPKRKKPYVRGPESVRYAYSVYGESAPRRKEWVQTPDVATNRPCAPKRKERVSPLTKIAQQLPMKRGGSHFCSAPTNLTA